MEILGIGPAELVFIFVIALIVLGPKDMQKAGKTVGRWLNQLIHSDGWKAFQRTTAEIRDLPNNLMREANLESQEKEIRRNLAFPPKPKDYAAFPPEHNNIQPPAVSNIPVEGSDKINDVKTPDHDA